MDRRDQKLLDKQLWGVSPSPSPRGIIIGFIAVFLVGIGIGDIMSKSKQAKTNDPAMVTAMIRDGGEIVSSGL